MKKNVLRIVCAVSLLTVTAASAEWRFAGYDTSNPPVYGKIYNEVLRGKFTNKQKVDPVDPEDVEWKFESYELEYPHAGYERLYLEGNAQKAVTRLTNRFPQWETRFQDYVWEVSGDHRIWQRQQTKIFNKTWKWDFGNNQAEEDLVFVPTTRFAAVTVDFKDYGFANLDAEGKYVFDVNGKVYNEEKYQLYSDFGVMPKAFNVKLDKDGNPTKEIVAGDFFSADNLSRLDATNQFAVADWDIADQIDKMESKFVTGPSYAGEAKTKDVAAMYFANRKFGWSWDSDTVTKNRVLYIDEKGNPITSSVKIAWGTPEYEMQRPYRYFQYLIVDGVIMDGHNDTPRIYRYTGGVATPEVQWRYAFAEADYPYLVVEYMYLKDKHGKWVLPVDDNDQPFYRYVVDEINDPMGRTYFKVTDTDIEFWVKDPAGDYMLYKKNRTEYPFGDWYAGYVGGATFVAE